MADELDKLAVGVAEDHQAAKRKRAKGDAPADPAPSDSAPPADADPVEGGPELRDAVAGLGDAIDARDADDDRATDFMVDRLTAIAEEAELDRGTLTGDVRDTLLDLFKANPKPWSQLSEDQQRRIAGALETCAKALIRSIVVIVAEDSAEGGTIHAKLEGYSEKGGLKITLSATADDESVLACHRANGQNVILMRADSNRYGGQRRDPDVDPDQPDLKFEGDQDPADNGNPFVAPEGDQDLVDAADNLRTGDSDG